MKSVPRNEETVDGGKGFWKKVGFKFPTHICKVPYFCATSWKPNEQA